MDRLINYLRDTKAELTHVTWPTQKQAITYTIIVVVLSVATALYLGFFDYLFREILDIYFV